MTRMAMAERGTPPQRLQMEPRPDEIATLRFSRKFFGVHPGEVRRALLEIAAALDRNRAAHTREMLEYLALEKSLGAATSTIQDLQQQLMAAKAELRACQDRERMLTRELLTGQGVQQRLGQVAETQPKDIVIAAQHMANTIMQTARTAALDVLHSARTAAQTMKRATDVDPVADANVPRIDGDLPFTPQRPARAAPRYRRGTLHTIV